MIALHNHPVYAVVIVAVANIRIRVHIPQAVLPETRRKPLVVALKVSLVLTIIVLWCGLQDQQQ